jgi:hypothetical protein
VAIDTLPQSSDTFDSADTSLIFGAQSALRAAEVKAQGGHIMPGYGNTPPYAVMPNGARLFAHKPVNEPNVLETAFGKALDALTAPAEPSLIGPAQPGQPAQPAGAPAPEEAAQEAVPAAAAPSAPRPAPASTPQVPSSTPPGAPPSSAVAGPGAGADPVAEMLTLLKSEIMKPIPGFTGPRPLSTGDHIAMGILGALSPQFFQSEIEPMLQNDRKLPLMQMEWEQQNHQRAIQMIQQFTSLVSVQQARESQAGARQDTARHDKVLEDIMRQRLAIEAERVRLSHGPKPMDQTTKRDLINIHGVKNMATDLLSFMQTHPEVGYPMTGALGAFSKDFADFSAKLGALRTSVAKGQFGSRITQTEIQSLLGAYVGANGTTTRKRAFIEEVYRWANDHEKNIKDEYSMEGLPGEEQPGRPEAPPGYTPVGMEIDDALLGR